MAANEPALSPRYTLPQAARMLGCSPATLTRHVEMVRSLTGLDIGTRSKRHWRVSAADLAEFIEQRLNLARPKE